MDGLLLVDKPKTWTSFDVVAKVRGTLKKAGVTKPKVGHTGTLDPLATGLLVLTLGSYCKRAQEFSKLDKVYEVELELGKTSTTDDAEGELTEIENRKPEIGKVEEVLQTFVGNIQQIPPAFSAIKVDGKRAYKLAREGKEVKLEARPVTIHSINNVTYNYPHVTFTAHVSSGTYIRSLVHDIGDKLQTGAYMTGLSRTKVGEFSLAKAISIDEAVSNGIVAIEI
jgi:tRNA pseudouridine55 synthase